MSDDLPTVSVIMTCWNTAPWVGEAIGSVLASSWPHIELCLVDDGSSDGTAELCATAAADDHRIRYIPLAGHVGRNAALHVAHEVATGSVLCWVDSDDRVHPDGIASAVAAIDADHQVVYTWNRLIDHRGEHRPRLRHNDRVAYHPARLLITNMIRHLRVFTRGVFEAADGIGGLPAAIDWDMNLRMAEHTTPRCLPVELYDYRIRRGRMSDRPDQFHASRVAIDQARARRRMPPL